MIQVKDSDMYLKNYTQIKNSTLRPKNYQDNKFYFVIPPKSPYLQD